MKKWTWWLIASACLWFPSKASATFLFHAPFHGMHTALPSFWGFHQAFLDWNLALALARENPMDDWRRKEVQEAKIVLDVKTKEFEAEVANGNLEPSDIEAAKLEVAEQADLGPWIDPYETGPTAERGAASPDTPLPETERAAGEPLAQAPAAAEGGPAITYIEIPGISTPNGIASAPPEKAGGQMDSARIDRTGLLVASARPEGESTDFSLAPPPSAFERTSTPPPAAKKPTAPALALEPPAHRPNLRPAAPPTREARIEAVRAAVRLRNPKSLSGVLRSKEGGPDIKISRLLPGGPILHGDFGGPTVALQVKPKEAGFDLVPLTEQDLWWLEAELAFYWTLVLLPLFYFAYRWGRARMPPDGEAPERALRPALVPPGLTNRR